MQSINDSAYSNYNAFGRSAEPIQTGRKPNIEFYGVNKSSIYGQEHQLQPDYLSDLKGQQQPRNTELSSYMHSEPEKNYGSHDKRICDRFWRNFCSLFKTKEKRHQKHRKYRKHHHRIREQPSIGEGYPGVQGAPSARSMSSISAAPEAKTLQTVPLHSAALETDQRKKVVEEKIEEKEKSNEKATISVEQMQQKTPEIISRIKLVDELPSAKQVDDEDQQMRQKRKVIQFIEQIAKAGMEGMKDEFVQCRSFIPNAIARTAHDQNLKRCRYPDIICIDQTRVVLKSHSDGSDFIHANRIPLGDNPNEIIITQLPLLNTVKHFWEMIWQENVQIILLFLTLNEWKQHAENIQLIPGKGKCLHIQEFMTLTHKNDINITSDWLVREYYLSKNNETRRILWLHYSGWEPNRSPKNCEYLWPLHSSLRKMRRPYVCMSLAGAGRAGCYAALEWAHLMLHDKGASTINIAECVRKVRTYRMHAVQTIAQFQFLYMGIQRHIFLVEKFRKEILSEQRMFEATKKCSSIEYNYFRCDGYPTNDHFDL